MANRSDNFNRTDSYPNGIGESSGDGTIWGEDVGGWGVESNQARSESGPGLFTTLECLVADGTVQVKIYNPGDAGLLFRSSDTTNYCFVSVKPGEIKLQTVIAGSYATVGPTYSYSHTPGDTIAADLSGSSITVKLNGVQIIVPQTITHNQTATKHGLWTYTDTVVRFDDFNFSDVSAPASTSGASILMCL